MLSVCRSNNIGKCRRWIIYIVSIIETVMFGGVIFGFGQLAFVLKKEGVFGYLCQNSNNGTEISEVVGCKEQDDKLALVYTIACTLYGGPSLLVGYALHHLGLAFTRITAGIMLVLGFFFMGYTESESYWLYPGMILLATGGNQLRMSGLQTANLFPSFRSTAMSIISGAYTASAGVFILVQWASDAGIGLKYSCWFLAGLSVLIFPATMIMPCHQIPYDDHEDSSTEVEEKIPLKDSILSISNCTFMYWYFISLTAVVLFGTYFNSWISRISTSVSEAALYSILFSLSQFVCPVVPPILGMFMDFINRKSKKESEKDEFKERVTELKSPFFPLTFVTIVVFILYSTLLFSQPWAIYVGLLCLVLSRPTIVGIGTPYLRIRFPPYHFNRMLGIQGTLMSILTMLNYAQFKWSQYHYVYAQVFMVCLIILSLVHPLHLLMNSYQERVARKQLSYDETNSTSVLKK